MENQYSQYLKTEINQRLSEGFRVCNIPKQIYGKIFDVLDFDDILKLFYEHIRNKLLENCDSNMFGECIMDRCQAKEILGRAFNIPRNMQVCLLNELSSKEYIRIINKQHILIMV